ncbi:MAG: stage II sporulation protein D [Bacillota bacterium]|nr:stage II sporulation protein D [Bacillota bacterium]
MRLSLSTVLWFCLAVVIGVPVALVLWLGVVGPGRPAEPQDTVTVWVEGQGPLTLALEDYLVGVVAAEVPALFEPEALKAQAVAARTYTVRVMRKYGGMGCAEHPEADISTDPRRGQAWASSSELRRKWGFWPYFRLWRRVTRAVEETRGEILTYDGQPIAAVYSSTCGGRTENSEDVWGTYVPYLRSVPCSWDRESPRYSETRLFTRAELEQRLGVSLEAVPALAGKAGREPMVILETGVSGRVREAMVGGKRFSGVELRTKLDLRSTRFTWRQRGSGVEITTIGNGHGVGLCQYGANGLAKLGRSYREILSYYYPGTVLQKLDDFQRSQE